LKLDLRLGKLKQRNLEQLAVGVAVEKDFHLLFQSQTGRVESRVFGDHSQGLRLLGEIGGVGDAHLGAQAGRNRDRK
jgi:hypothetical protein